MYELKSTSTAIFENRLINNRSAIVAPNGEGMTVLLDCVYYPFGNGWAKVLGLASGSAPTQSCEKNLMFFAMIF
jgi:hypothetical protein